MANLLFSEKGIEHTKSQRLGRIATAAAGIESLSAESMQPDVVLVGFDFDGDFFYVGGMNILSLS